LVIAAVQGDESAWRELVRVVGPAVLAYARAQGSRDPDDILGDVLTGLVRSIGTFHGDLGGFKAWAVRVAHSRIVDERRRATRRPALSMAEPPEPRLADFAEDLVGSAWVEEALSDLLPLHRDVLLLRVIAGLSADETAEIVGKRPGAVRTIQHRALARLRERLAVDPVTDGRHGSVPQVR